MPRSAPDPSLVPPLSLAAGAGARLLLATGLAALLWGGVLWALQGGAA